MRVFIAILFVAMAVTGQAKTKKQVEPIAASTLLYDIGDDNTISSTNSIRVMPIASITKLMTVYTVLSENQNLNEMITVDRIGPGSNRLIPGMILSRRDLIMLSLVSSDNKAADTLSRNFPGGQPQFVSRMNYNAALLGMKHTNYVDPTGLYAGNTSTTYDVNIITQAAGKFSIVRQAASLSSTTVIATKGKKLVSITGNTTSPFPGRPDILAFKTGYTNPAGYCLTMLIEYQHKKYNIVILNARSKIERKQLADKMLVNIGNLETTEVINDDDVKLPNFPLNLQIIF